MRRLVKYVVQAHVIEEDEDGVVVDELHSEPIPLYGDAALEEWRERFKAELESHDEG